MKATSGVQQGLRLGDLLQSKPPCARRVKRKVQSGRWNHFSVNVFVEYYMSRPTASIRLAENMLYRCTRVARRSAGSKQSPHPSGRRRAQSQMLHNSHKISLLRRRSESHPTLAALHRHRWDSTEFKEIKHTDLACITGTYGFNCQCLAGMSCRHMLGQSSSLPMGRAPGCMMPMARSTWTLQPALLSML